ncbi:hypothetical protein STRDD13_00686 [Streptococcus sp. DD13]|nr:hypothetical protein STRDD13_00686 [Streptococcus sp. DD13]
MYYSHYTFFGQIWSNKKYGFRSSRLLLEIKKTAFTPKEMKSRFSNCMILLFGPEKPVSSIS